MCHVAPNVAVGITFYVRSPNVKGHIVITMVVTPENTGNYYDEHKLINPYSAKFLKIHLEVE